MPFGRNEKRTFGGADLRIGIVGGGPAGLYFALLMKRHYPEHEIKIVEQNPAGATYGWGVVFSGRALSFMQDNDPESYIEIESRLEAWDDLTIVYKGNPVQIDGSAFSGISRLDLLNILQKHCLNCGVEIEFERRLTDLESFVDCDLIVGADGINSTVREIYRDYFQPSETFLSNKYIWYGTNQRFDTLSLIFRENQDGVFVAHAYPYSKTTSTFIVECDAKSWTQAGFASISEEEGRRYCENVFKDDLSDHPLLSNKSVWLNFKMVNNEHWTYRNIVLLGDALRTVHFSIGSGTRTALEDAIALYKAYAMSKDVSHALQEFKTIRKPSVDKLLATAHRSSIWYEKFHEKMHLDALPFAYDYMRRGGRISHDRLRQQAPKFIAAYEDYITSSTQ